MYKLNNVSKKIIMSITDIHYFLFFAIYFKERKISMKRIDKDGKKRKFNIEFIHKKDGIKLEEIMKEGYLCYLRNLKVK